MIKQRVLYGAVMIALLTGALFLPLIGVFLIIPVLATLMLWEFYGLLAHAGVKAYRTTGLVGGLVLIVLSGLQYAYGWLTVPVSELEGIVLALIVLVVFVNSCCASRSTQPLQQLGGTFLGVLYVSFLLNFMTKLLMQWPAGQGDGRILLFYMILVVKVTDMAAYFTGCSVGRRKLVPRISPAKTWEGCAGGVLGGLVTSLIFWWVTGGQIGPVTFSVAHAAILGIVLPVTGIIGDLIESLMKRAAEVKDSGSIFKGMGGVMDVLDSLIFAAPVLYLFLMLAGKL